jgi:hypothetical protein
MSAFVSGQELSRRFYLEAVRPILDSKFPGLPHSAALLGRGSEVLGFDDEMSGDHNWEPRVLLFLTEKDRVQYGDALGEALRQKVPPRFADHQTEYGVHTLRSFFLDHLVFDIEGELEARDWLTFPEQRLLMITAGAVFHDDVGLQAVRDRFAYYPQDVWYYLLIAGWWRVHPEYNLVGRTGFVGDELGSALIGSELVDGLMRLCFLMEREYAPYSKWFGTAFSRLPCGAELSPLLQQVLRAESWQDRESALMAAYEGVAARHNALQITPPVALGVEQMWDRPFKVSWGDFPTALAAQIEDPTVKEIAERWPVGAIDQLREILWFPSQRERLLRLFD